MPEYQALICSEIKDDPYSGIDAMQFVTRTRKPLTAGEVRVSVRSCSLNFPELLMLQNKYQFKPPLPFTLCTEGSGVVLEAASGSKWRPGDRVFFNSLRGVCTEEYTAKEGELLPLPDSLTFSQGAGFLMGYDTGYHALVHRGKLQAGEWLLVTGAGGGMGMAAVQLGKALGAKVIAAASSDAKLAACKQAGADFTINYGLDGKNLKDEVRRITKGKFCDVIYEPVGGSIFDNCVRCVSPAGYSRLLVVGFASGRIPKLPINMALIKGFDLVGVRMGEQLMRQPELREATHATLLKWAGQGKLKPYVSQEFPFERAKQAFRLMAERKVIGKCCIVFNERGDGLAKL